MVKWPKVCIGCTESDPSKLKNYAYTRKKNLTQTSQDMAANQQPYFYVETSAYLCNACLQKARTQFLLRLILSLILFLIGGYFIFDFDLPTPFFIIGFLMMVTSIPILVLTIVMRRKFPNFYWKYKVKNREEPIFQFQNQQFAQIFKQANPDDQVEGI